MKAGSDRALPAPSRRTPLPPIPTDREAVS
jgi:hypothetical protein